MQTVSNPPPRCCEHAAQVAELERQLADVRRSLLGALTRMLDPTPAAPVGTSGPRLRAVS